MIKQTLSDKRMIEELSRGRERLFADGSFGKLLSTVQRRLQSITRNIYIVHWIPEQLEDLYDLLIDGETIVRVEIPRNDGIGETVFEKWTVNEYLRNQKNLGKIDRRRLRLAIELSQGKDPSTLRA